MHDLPPGFGSPDLADQHLGFAPFGPQGPVQAVQFGQSSALGNPGVLEGMNPWVLASIGAVVAGAAGGAIGYQKSPQVAAIAGGAGALVGGLLGYYGPSLFARLTK
jgi:hypothetical protein